MAFDIQIALQGVDDTARKSEPDACAFARRANGRSSGSFIDVVPAIGEILARNGPINPKKSVLKVEFPILLEEVSRAFETITRKIAGK